VYIDRSGNAIREYPQELLKKLLIDWWVAKFAAISLDEVDSYILFSRCMDIVRRDYRVIYNQGVQLRKKEQPHGTYAGLARWMKENRVRVFGNSQDGDLPQVHPWNFSELLTLPGALRSEIQVC
jgi:hypothetical protein